MKRTFFFGAALLLLAPVAPLLAQETTLDPYRALVDALNPSANNSAQFERVIDTTIAQAMLLDPEIADLDEWCPGSVTAMIGGARAIFLRDLEIGQRQFTDGSYTIIAASLTEAEASEAAEFYSSPLGSKILDAAGSGTTYDNVMRDAMQAEDGTISREAINKDQRANSAAVLRSLSAEDRFQLTLLIGSASWGRKMKAIQPKLVDLRYAIENEPTTAEEDAEMEAAMSGSLEPHIKACEARDEAEG